MAMGALAIGSAIGQYFSGIQAAKEAGRINEETYRRFKEAGEQYYAEMEGILPPGTVDPIQWQQLKKEVERYAPDAAKYIPEAAPQQITEGATAEEQQAQKEALRQYGAMAKAGYDPIAAAQQEQALSASAAQASASRQAALREAAQRGLGGTGLDVLSGMGATEQAAVAGRQAALQAQQEAGQRRMQALGQYGTLAGQMRQQGAQTEQANVNIMNAFNERMSRNLNQYNQYVAELKNKADLFNLQNRQQREEALVQQQNQQKLMDAQRAEAAAEARRAARERAVTTRYGIQTGLAKMSNEQQAQALEKQVASEGQLYQTGGRIGEYGMQQSLKNFYNTKPKSTEEEV
jgi:hypothetical protein